MTLCYGGSTNYLVGVLLRRQQDLQTPADEKQVPPYSFRFTGKPHGAQAGMLYIHVNMR